jgi:hypothetical protein
VVGAGGRATDITVTADTPVGTTFESASPAPDNAPAVGGTGTSAKFNACGDGPTVAGSGVCQPQVGVSTSGKNSLLDPTTFLPVGGTVLTTASFNSGTTGLTTFTYYSIPAANYTAVINSQGTSTSATTCATTGWTKITTGPW